MTGIRNWLLLTVILLSSLTSTAGLSGAKKTNRIASDSARTLQANRIVMSVNDRGCLIRSLNDDWGVKRFDSALQFFGGLAPIVFDHGPWIIGKINGAPRAAISYWGTSYMPGPVINGSPALIVRPQDSLRYHPYMLNSRSNSSNNDFVTWPADLGAPVDPSGKPLLLGDELIWSVFNGADSTAHPLDQGFGPISHLPVEIQQSVYAHASSTTDTSLLGNTVFMEWTFINKGTATIESCYVALWTDIDFDDFEHNFPAVDTSLQVGYCWDGLATPEGSPYAVGYVLLHGPIVPDPSGTSFFRGRVRPGYKNLALSSFWGIISDVGPVNSFIAGPTSMSAAWNVARGYDKAGGVILDSVSKTPTRFPYSGDPVSGTGWVYNLVYTAGEEGFLMFTGPFNFAPGDTQWVMTALVPALGSDRFESIRVLRRDATLLRGMSYDAIAKAMPLSVARGQGLPISVALFQNYPNPFNPSTTIRYALPIRAQVTLSVFNTLGQQVAVLVNENQEAGYHDVRFDGRGVASGVYFYRLRAGDYVAARRLVVVR